MNHTYWTYLEAKDCCMDVPGLMSHIPLGERPQMSRIHASEWFCRLYLPSHIHAV